MSVDSNGKYINGMESAFNTLINILQKYMVKTMNTVPHIKETKRKERRNPTIFENDLSDVLKMI